MERKDRAALRFEEAEKIIQLWDSATSEEARRRMIFDGDRIDAGHYIDSVDEIQRILSQTTLENDVKRANAALQISMARLEDEFRNLLVKHANRVDFTSLMNSRSNQNTSSATREEDGVQGEELKNEREAGSRNRGSIPSIREIDLIPSHAIHDLRVVAERMVSAGYSRACTQVYRSVRRSALDANFREVGVEKLSIVDIQRLEWDVLEMKIRRWTSRAKICVRVLLASERRLCEQILGGLLEDSAMGDSCFFETVKGPVTQLLDFAEAVSISRRAPEKLFKILDIRDTLSDLLPDIDRVFDRDSIRSHCSEIISRLSEAVRGTLSEFENAIFHEESRVPAGGTIHPMTRYVMNYIDLIVEYRESLEEIILTKPTNLFREHTDPFPDIDMENLQGTPLTAHLIWIMAVTLSNMDSKSIHYNDPSLSHIFMMNNVHYIVEKAKKSTDLHRMIGDDYLKKLTFRFRQEATRYQRSTWMTVLQCLKDEGLYVGGNFTSGISKTALRERFKVFNSMFDGIRKRQSSWHIPDPQLREELRIAMSENLIRAYGSFLSRFKHHIESGKHPDHYIKYSVDDLEDIVLDFFQGHAVVEGNKRRSH